jgi:predicted Zn-dependent protease
VVRVAALLSQASLHLEGGRPEEALTAARAAADLAPRSRVAPRLEAWALGALGRRQELGRLAERVRRTVPSDAATQREVAQAAERAGDLELSRDLLQDLAEQPRAASADLNNLAWLRLFLGGPLAPARREAQRAVERGDQDPYPELHTLATVLAADGEPAQAIETLRKALDSRSAFSPVDDLVVGKVAETYGLADAALAAYRRVEAAAEGDSQISAAALARRWRSALEGRPAR